MKLDSGRCCRCTLLLHRLHRSLLFGVFGKRWVGSRIADPTSLIRYETDYRLHVEPTFRTLSGPEDSAVAHSGLGFRLSLQGVIAGGNLFRAHRQARQ
jgi:hypothetical protein